MPLSLKELRLIIKVSFFEISRIDLFCLQQAQVFSEKHCTCHYSSVCSYKMIFHKDALNNALSWLSLPLRVFEYTSILLSSRSYKDKKTILNRQIKQIEDNAFNLDNNAFVNDKFSLDVRDFKDMSMS